jgi:ribosomal protein L7/L12
MMVSTGIKTEVEQLISQKRKIEAIKLVHDDTGCSLKEAKDYIDNLAAGMVTQAPAMSNEDMDMRLMALLSQGKKLEAVKLYKDATHLGLAESKDHVDGLQQRATAFITGPTRANNKRETQIDDILKQQSQSGILVNVSQGVSPQKILFFIVVAIIVIGVLMYLFVAL